MSALDDLLQKSRDLNNQITNNALSNPSNDVKAMTSTLVASTLPRIERDLSQVIDAGNRLWEKLGCPNNFSDEDKAKAALILNKKDANFVLPSQNANLKRMLKNKNLQPLEPCKNLE